MAGAAATTAGGGGGGGGAKKRSANCEVQSIRWEKNEAVARREQLGEWVKWLRTALATFASPAAAIEVFVRRTHQLCEAGIDRSRVPTDMLHVFDGQQQPQASSITPAMVQQQQQQRRRLSLLPVDGTDDQQHNDQHHPMLLSEEEKKHPRRNCEVLCTLASLAALLALGEAWSDGFKAGSLPSIGGASAQQLAQRGQSLKSLIRAVCDDLASGVFFTPPSMGCTTPEDVVTHLGGSRAFSDVFRDMISVAVFHRDRAETCRYLELRRETVLGRCIDNFRRDHAAATLRMWHYYTMQQKRKRTRLWQKVVRARELLLMKTHIQGWRRFATHVHLATIHSANQRNEAILAQMRGKVLHLQEWHAKALSENAQRKVDKADAQERFDEVEVRAIKSRERFASATAKYLEVRRDWADVVKALFNDDQRIPYHPDAKATTCQKSEEPALVTFSPINTSSAASVLASPTKAASASAGGGGGGANNNSSNKMTMKNKSDSDDANRSWQAGSKAIQWAKFILSVYAPSALKTWEKESDVRARLQNAGLLTAGGALFGAELDDKFGDIPYVSITAVRELLSVLTYLHRKNAVFPSVLASSSSPAAAAAGPASGAASVRQKSSSFTLHHRVTTGDVFDFNSTTFDSSSGSVGAVTAAAAAAASRGRNASNRALSMHSALLCDDAAAAAVVARTTLARRTLAEEVWDFYSEICDCDALLRVKPRNDAPIDPLLSGYYAPAKEMVFVDGPLRQQSNNDDKKMSASSRLEATAAASTVLPDSGIKTSGSASFQASNPLIVLQGPDSSQLKSIRGIKEQQQKQVGVENNNASNNNSKGLDDDEAAEKQQRQAHNIIPLYLVPPVSLTDLIRQDQLRLLILVVHLAQLWCGGYAGAFFCKSRSDDAHDRRPAVVVSRLAQQPRQGKMAVVEETEDMMADWSQGVQALASGSAGAGSNRVCGGDSAMLQVGLDEGIRECIEFGHASYLRQMLQGLFDLLTLGDVIDRHRMERLLLSISSEERRQEHEVALEEQRKRQQLQISGDGNNSPTSGGASKFGTTTNLGAKARKPGMSSSSSSNKLTSFLVDSDNNKKKKEQLADDWTHNSGKSRSEARLLYPPWPPAGISNVSELGLYISDTVHVGYDPRVLAERLTEVLMQESPVAFAHSVFAPSEPLKEELAKRQPALTKVFTDFSVVSRAPVPDGGGVNAKATTARQQQLQQQHHVGTIGRSQQKATTAASSVDNSSSSFVFAKKSFLQWLVQCVMRVFGELTPQGSDAESLYTSAVAYAPERDMALLELLVCATATFVDPNPFQSTEEKVIAFCAKMFS